MGNIIMHPGEACFDFNFQLGNAIKDLLQDRNCPCSLPVSFSGVCPKCSR